MTRVFGLFRFSLPSQRLRRRINPWGTVGFVLACFSAGAVTAFIAITVAFVGGG